MSYHDALSNCWGEIIFVTVLLFAIKEIGRFLFFYSFFLHFCFFLSFFCSLLVGVSFYMLCKTFVKKRNACISTLCTKALWIKIKLCTGSRIVQTGLNQLLHTFSKVNNWDIMLDLCYNVWNYKIAIMGAVDTMSIPTFILKSTYKRVLQNNRTTLRSCPIVLENLIK